MKYFILGFFHDSDASLHVGIFPPLFFGGFINVARFKMNFRKYSMRRIVGTTEREADN